MSELLGKPSARGDLVSSIQKANPGEYHRNPMFIWTVAGVNLLGVKAENVLPIARSYALRLGEGSYCYWLFLWHSQITSRHAILRGHGWRVHCFYSTATVLESS